MAGAVGGRWRYLGEPVARAACAGSSAAVRGADDLVLAVVAGHGPGVALERGSHLLVAVPGTPAAAHNTERSAPPLPRGAPAPLASLSAQDRGGSHVGLGVP